MLALVISGTKKLALPTRTAVNVKATKTLHKDNIANIGNQIRTINLSKPEPTNSPVYSLEIIILLY